MSGQEATISGIYALGVGLGEGLLQVRDNLNCGYGKVPENKILHPFTFANKSLSSVEWWYSNIERQALRILHGLENFHHYCFAHEVHVITDHKQLVAIMDVEMLSQHLQHIILYIHQ